MRGSAFCGGDGREREGVAVILLRVGTGLALVVTLLIAQINPTPFEVTVLIVGAVWLVRYVLRGRPKPAARES
jgi:hypothetical protein